MMKRALQNLFRKGEGDLTKILCLGVGMAIGLVMLAEVIFERSYDNFIPHLEDTYIIQENYKPQGNDWKITTPYRELLPRVSNDIVRK